MKSRIAKKAFTLLEIIIVLSIISILLTVTLRFWSNRIKDLTYQSTKEQFVATYEQLYSQTLTSNYHNNIRYDTLHITLGSWAKQLSYRFDNGVVQSSHISEPFILSGLKLDDKDIENVNISMRPYTLGCTLWISWSMLSFTLLVEQIQSYCFTINNDTCKLIEKKCE